MDTLLSLKAEYRGTAALALQNEFFTTEPFACDPSSLLQCPLRRVRNYERNRRVRAIPAAEANAEFKSNIDRKRLIAHSEAQNRLEKTNEYVSGGALDEGINSSECFQVSSRKEGSENYTQREIRKEPIHDIKGKKKWSGTLPAPSGKMHDLLIEHDPMILKPARRAKLEKGSTAKGNDHDSKGKKNHSLCPSTSTSNATIGNGQISTHLPAKLTNMQRLLEEHKRQILKDAQSVISDKEKMAEGKGNNTKAEKNQLEQLSPPAESHGLDFLEDNQYFGPLPSASKLIDVDRIIREHDRQIQESVERAKQQKKLAKARY
ncbi:probable serine/threonine-protein kinase At1g09600 [Solanum tuberosum]|uniref:Uncharacterized protein n=1 Tax=Solanum tuberosum TaxID=4113 RepID=M1CSW2_SOLTU|nr:PREDICTED: probable serine/threonine-protein kinase At1g09600 [Solanum tuberosum]